MRTFFRRRAARRTALYTLSLAFAAAAVLQFYMGRIPAATAQPTGHVFNAGRDGATCNLPVIEQVKAVDAFSKMVPVFRHPRCFNCHGNFDIASTDEHTGATAVPKDIDFREALTVPQRQRLHAECAECHNQITGHANRPTAAGDVIVRGWMMAPGPMQWVKAKDSEQLCILVKGFEENADSFISHVKIDHGEIQFLKAAFEGKRALDSATMDTYDVVAERPPGSMESLIADGTRWARLIGDHWKDSRDCGCVKPKVELVMRGEITGKSQGQTISGEFSSSVMLEPDTQLVYKGEGTVALSNFKLPMPANCQVSSNVPPSKIAVKEVRFGMDGSDGISLLVFPENTTGSHTVTCPGFPQPLTMPVFTPMQQWRFAHGRDLQGTDYFFKEFEAKPQSGSGRTMVGRKEVTRTVSTQGVDVTARTIFEIWTVPPGQQ